MKLVIQRVKEAHVMVEGKIIGQIQKGALVFLGVHKDDKPDDTVWLSEKLIHLRFFSDEQGKMNLSLKDVRGAVLVVSQFTLYANCNEGRRPDFLEAAPSAVAKPIYEKFIKEVGLEIPVQTGVFGAEMEVGLINDGPLTLILGR